MRESHCVLWLTDQVSDGGAEGRTVVAHQSHGEHLQSFVAVRVEAEDRPAGHPQAAVRKGWPAESVAPRDRRVAPTVWRRGRQNGGSRRGGPVLSGVPQAVPFGGDEECSGAGALATVRAVDDR